MVFTRVVKTGLQKINPWAEAVVTLGKLAAKVAKY